MGQATQPEEAGKSQRVDDHTRFEAVYRIHLRSGSSRIVLSRAVVAADPEASSAPTLFAVDRDLRLLMMR